MDNLIGTIGLMFCIFVVSELLAAFCRKTDTWNIPNFIAYPIAILTYLCMICSAPSGLYMMWHDKVKEKIHRQIYEEDIKNKNIYY